jgi:hypothetical protein
LAGRKLQCGQTGLAASSDSTSAAQLFSLSSLSSKPVSWLVGIREIPARARMSEKLLRYDLIVIDELG